MFSPENAVIGRGKIGFYSSHDRLLRPYKPLLPSPDKMEEQTKNKQTNKNLYTLQTYTSHSKAYEATEEGLKTTVDQNNGEGVAETAGRMLGIGVGFIIMVSVLYSPKYIYSIQTDTKLISTYSIDGKLQESIYFFDHN